MPIIKRIEKTEKTNVSVRIEDGIAEKLKKYSEYTNVPVSEIVETAIKYVINSDAEFLQSFCQKTAGKTLAEAKANSHANGA
jgi:hypothetical protein